MGREVLNRAAGRIRVGVGGWTYAPWRETFYPEDLPHARELEYASRQLTAIEVNGTFYRTQTPATYAKWRDETPDDFVFTLKAPRYTTQRAVLSEVAPGIERFMQSGIDALGPKLGPILWSFAPTKRYVPHDFEAFLKLLPREAGKCGLRHVIDVRHESFATPEFVGLARAYGAAIALSDTDKYAGIADVTADFVYARLKRCASSVETGYEKNALETWGARARLWASGAEPDDLPRVEAAQPKSQPRDVFLFFIAGAKERAPAAARELLKLVQ